MFSPVINPAFSEQRNKAISAISSDLPTLPTGCCNASFIQKNLRPEHRKALSIWNYQETPYWTSTKGNKSKKNGNIRTVGVTVNGEFTFFNAANMNGVRPLIKCILTVIE